MDRKILIENNSNEVKNNLYSSINEIVQYNDDKTVNDFLNKNISLEEIIENEMFDNKIF